MTRYRITVCVAGNPNYQVEVEAESEGKAQSRAMISYPHRLRGATVRYTVKEIEPIADKPHIARKAGPCVSRTAAEAGNAPECRRTIEVGDTYFDGEMDPYKAGGFGKERVCAECHRMGYA